MVCQNNNVKDKVSSYLRFIFEKKKPLASFSLYFPRLLHESSVPLCPIVLWKPLFRDLWFKPALYLVLCEFNSLSSIFSFLKYDNGTNFLNSHIHHPCRLRTCIPSLSHRILSIRFFVLARPVPSTQQPAMFTSSFLPSNRSRPSFVSNDGSSRSIYLATVLRYEGGGSVWGGSPVQVLDQSRLVINCIADQWTRLSVKLSI